MDKFMEFKNFIEDEIRYCYYKDGEIDSKIVKADFERLKLLLDVSNLIEEFESK